MEEHKKEYIAIGIIFFLIVIFAFYFLVTKTAFNTNKIFTELDNNKSFLIFFTNSNNKKCSNCEEIKKTLKDLEIKYYSFDMAKETTASKSDLLNKLDIDFEVVYPSLFIISDGKMYANIIDIENTDVETFIKLNNVSKDGTIKE